MEQYSMFQAAAEDLSPCERDYPGCPCLTCTVNAAAGKCCIKATRTCGQPCPDYEREGA